MNKFKGDDIIENNYIIYMHVSPSNKRYIGLTIQKPEYRWNNGKGYKNNQYFTNAIEKYGWDNFQHIIIAKGLTEEEAKWLEIELIEIWDSANRNNGYNISLGGEGANGYHHTKETILKISGENNHNYGKTGEKHPMFGRQHTEEVKRKISEANSGENNPNARMVILLNTKEVFLTAKEGAEKYNTHCSSVSQCCNGGYKNSGKLNDGTPLVWMFYDEYLNATDEEIQKKLKDADTRIILLNTKEVFLTAKEGAEKYNTYCSSVLSCCNGERKSAGKHLITNEKLVWMFYKDYLYN